MFVKFISSFVAILVSILFLPITFFIFMDLKEVFADEYILR